jgi:hypothetical protein
LAIILPLPSALSKLTEIVAACVADAGVVRTAATPKNASTLRRNNAGLYRDGEGHQP